MAKTGTFIETVKHDVVLKKLLRDQIVVWQDYSEVAIQIITCNRYFQK